MNSPFLGSPLLEGAKEAAAKAAAAVWQSSFTPRRWLRNGHLQTLAGNYLPRNAVLGPPENEFVEVAPGDGSMPASRVLCQSHWQAEQGRPTLLLLHGLEGSSQSQYVRGNAARFFAAGWNVVRMNMRNCGGTEHETPTLYHSGLSGDVQAVVRHYQRARHAERWALVGYSMGGNVVLKLVGELRDAASPLIFAAAGVSPAMDLAASSDALHEPANRVYEWSFLRRLVRRYLVKCRLFPQIYDPSRARGLRSLRDFDDRVMSPYCGFAGADDYYHRAASARVASDIVVPTLVLHALDDPFIRMLDATRATLLENSNTHLVETDHGGHCAFLEAATDYDGYWAERLLFNFLHAQAAHAG
ncbi:MAG: alpha/beta hydrolase fold protein [Acidobacteriaceae bacterium]|nr:alpha/beta hydrolase fold protein [Acidobacteriaceae bacterium]